MKKITVLRHSKLRPPFDNYNQLDYKLLCQLANKSIDPPIDSNFAKHKLNIDYKDLKPEIILHSPAQRTTATAKIFAKHFSVPTKTVPEIKEIPFTLQNLLSQEEFEENGMSQVRKRFWKQILIGQLDETIDSIQKRVVAFESTLNQQNAESIICITHGFLMRFLRIYFELGIRDFDSLTEDLLNSVSNDDYLNGFDFMI